MATFLVMLADMEGNVNWRYPTEIEARDKQDAYQAICESCPPESIKAILTPAEYKAKMSNKNVQTQMRMDAMNNADMSGNDFMNQMINMAMAAGEENNEQTANQSQPQNYPSEQNAQKPANQEPINQTPIKQNTNASEPKYFTDNGIMFKIENGILYKKCWESVNLSEYTDDDGKTILPEYRIINLDSGKPFKSDKYGVQQLIWKPLNDL
jgi:hypothetical protein